METSWLPLAPELLERQPPLHQFKEQTDHSSLPPVEKLGNGPPFFDIVFSNLHDAPGSFALDGSLPTPTAPFDFSFMRSSTSDIRNQKRLTPTSRPSKRQKRAPCDSPVPSEPSECCSSCSDGMPCVDPDCDAEEDGLPCEDPNCDIPREKIIICNGDDYCNTPVCTSQCIEMSTAHSSLLGTGDWTGNDIHNTTGILNRQFHPGPLHQTETFNRPSNSSPSMVNNISTPYSPDLEIQTPQAPISVTRAYVNGQEEVTYGNTAIPTTEPSNETSGLFIQPWSDVGDKSAMFYCPWEGCNQALESEQWMTHFHREHVDPQMTFRCPFQAETCPPSMDTNPVAHLETDHGYIFDSNGNGFSCPSPTCDQDLTFCDPSTLHNHLDFAHATPGSGALRCRLNSCDNLFEDSNQLVSHVYQDHPLPSLLSQHDNLDLSLPQALKPWKDDVQVRIPSKRKDAAEPPLSSPVPGVATEKLGSDLVHGCKWKLANGTICQQSCDSEIELQNHIKDVHLEPLDNKTGYHCRWEGCMRDSKLGAKSGFSQRGKLERHMATHTNFKCATCDICNKSFSAPQAMKQHRRLHTGERPWKCKHCDKTFAQQSACTVHERTHTNEKPLKCPICHKKFSESSNLAKHRKTHGEKGAHVCTVRGCGKAYHRFDQLKRHMLAHRDGGSEEEDGE